MKKNIQFVSIIITFVGLLFLCNPSFVYAAMSGDSGNDKANLYKEAERFVLRAKKLEKKDKIEKALKLYSKAYKKLLKAYQNDKNKLYDKLRIINSSDIKLKIPKEKNLMDTPDIINKIVYEEPY